MMQNVVLSGTGLFTPKESISNEELVQSFNQYVDSFNKTNESAIKKGDCAALAYSSADFIVKASGIRSRYVIDKAGILNATIMHPVIEERADDCLSLQAEMAIYAAKEAMQKASKSAKDIDVVIAACSNFQRPYPAIAIEVQKALGITGFALDMNVACSSATFALVNAKSFVQSQLASTVLVVNPEICTAHLNFCDRDSHFIFGDVATAFIIENEKTAELANSFEIIDTKLQTDFSSHIRNNGGFMARLNPSTEHKADKLFYQNGRKVFKEVTAKVISHLQWQLEEQKITPTELKKLWLHQANANMNRLISTKLMAKEVDETFAPTILDTYANTASSGSVIAFHHHHSDLKKGDLGLLCSFGAGYSIGSVILRKG